MSKLTRQPVAAQHHVALRVVGADIERLPKPVNDVVPRVGGLLTAAAFEHFHDGPVIHRPSTYVAAVSPHVESSGAGDRQRREGQPTTGFGRHPWHQRLELRKVREDLMRWVVIAGLLLILVGCGSDRLTTSQVADKLHVAVILNEGGHLENLVCVEHGADYRCSGTFIESPGAAKDSLPAADARVATQDDIEAVQQARSGQVAYDVTVGDDGTVIYVPIRSP